jgi:hypothetical protein
MPIQAGLFDHFITSFLLVFAHHCIVKYVAVQHDAAQYVGAVKACDKEEKGGK